LRAVFPLVESWDEAGRGGSGQDISVEALCPLYLWAPRGYAFGGAGYFFSMPLFAASDCLSIRDASQHVWETKWEKCRA
jgi:hypothetical protein